MLRFLRGNILYVQIYMNRFQIRNITTPSPWPSTPQGGTEPSPAKGRGNSEAPEQNGRPPGRPLAFRNWRLPLPWRHEGGNRLHGSSLASSVIFAFSTFDTGQPAFALLAAVSNA